MRAAVMRNKKLVVADIPVPEPGPGEVLVKTLACGICGSDLHALKFADKLVDAVKRSGGGAFVMDLNRDVVMGHEFCCEVVDYGPNTQKRLKPGTRVCSFPVLIRATGPEAVGYSNDNPGGYGEFMRLTEGLLLEVPNGLSTEHAALTEPMAVGYHAVQMARLDKRDVPLVVGCGPVGLAVIAGLKLKGAAPIVAADFSPRRREMALKMGADVVVDPKEKSPYASWKEMAADSSGGAGAVPSFMGGPALRPAVIFECVGVPGVIDQIMMNAPRGARVVVVGVCMESDQIQPFFGINKELNIQFVLGYTPEEFNSTLYNIADGKIPVTPLITGKVGVEGVAQAFTDLGSPERHAKILVEPWHS
jgi:threonine dehydrogenase-like Zn-dependent dehydrogenase